MNTIITHPEETSRKLLGVLSKRMKDVIEMRFGLGRKARMTLEAIGVKYGITRERVRQIEADALGRIGRSAAMADLGGIFATLEDHFIKGGGVLQESYALTSLAGHPRHENHVYFLLTLHRAFERYHESDELHSRWVHTKIGDEHAQKTLSHAVEELRRVGKPVSEPQLFEVLSLSAKSFGADVVPHGVLANWLGISKLLGKNYYGEWGPMDLPSIKPRGVRDLSHLVMTKIHKPMHFAEVARAIGALVGHPVHVQTVHNELIKDNRFVLVGRGLYALSDWGFETGTVKDVITGVLRGGPLSKEKVVELVLAKRLVKPNTITVNLENKRSFKKLGDGRYSVR